MSKVAIITGAGRGIGAAIAKRLLANNFNVVIAEKDLSLKKLWPNSANILFIKTDIASEVSIKEMVSKTVRHFGKIDALVNNAGLLPDSLPSIEKMPLKTWHNFIQTNLTGAFLCSKHTIPHLRKTKGSILNIASTRFLQSEGNDAPYSAAKGGLVSLTHALAIECGPSIRINCISPGWINSGNEHLKKSDHTQHPVGRVGRKP